MNSDDNRRKEAQRYKVKLSAFDAVHNRRILRAVWGDRYDPEPLDASCYHMYSCNMPDWAGARDQNTVLEIVPRPLPPSRKIRWYHRFWWWLKRLLKAGR